MFIQPYQLEELRFATCFRVYYRWRTYRVRSTAELTRLDRETLDTLLREYGIHILEASASGSEVRVLASLLATESVASCASKMKGRVSKWLRGQLAQANDGKLLSRGYFASTTGKSTADAVLTYLESQGEHHGYESRPLPPVFVASFSQDAAEAERLNAAHAATVLRFHMVLSTWKRAGVFGRTEAEAVTGGWKKIERQHPLFIEKVSFVPDHVHLAVWTHPSLSPARAVTTLMNAGQELIWREYSSAVSRLVWSGFGKPAPMSAVMAIWNRPRFRRMCAIGRRWTGSSDEPNDPAGKPLGFSR